MPTDRPHIVILAKGGNFWAGGRQYTINLLQSIIEYSSVKRNFDISVITHSAEELQYYEKFRDRLRVCTWGDDFQARYTLSNRIRWRVKRAFGWRIPRLEEALIRIGATFVYPAHLTRIRSANWIPDFQYDHYPNGSNSTEISERKQEFSEIVSRAERIVLSSATAEGDCVRLFPDAQGRTFVLRFRASLDKEVLEKHPGEITRLYHLPERFVLTSNLLAPTKNHDVIIEAISALQEMGDKNLHFVWTGDIYDYRNPGYYNHILASIAKRGVASRITMLGVIPKKHQIQLLRASAAYLQPSLFEGWNTGVEEARMLGKKIFLSDIPVHREQNPPNGSFFDPRNSKELAALLDGLGAQDVDKLRRQAEENAALVEYASLQRTFAEDFLSLAL